jgi:predicted DsbA family dithiol-disulfide isomerase
VLLQRAREQGRDFEVGWRYFSLTQVNNKEEGWTVWGAPEEEPVRGRLAFKAAEAARRQGAFERLHMPLLQARHVRQRELEQLDPVRDVARSAGLDLTRFDRDLAAADILSALARDHQTAVAEHGVFGTPTLVFEEGAAAYVRIRPAPVGEEALALFDELTGAIANRPYLLEIKRPPRP